MNNNFLISPIIPELYCTNIAISLDFYTKTLGFCVQYQREEEGFAMLERQGVQVMLNELREDSVNNRLWLTAPLEKPFGRGINFQIKSVEVDELYEHVKSAKANVFLPIEEKWYRAKEFEFGNRQFIVLDPDGYMLRFFQDLGKRRVSR